MEEDEYEPPFLRTELAQGGFEECRFCNKLLKAKSRMTLPTVEVTTTMMMTI
jgi:hypothetical protein